MGCSCFLQWLLILVLTIGKTYGYGLGVNWGSMASHKLPPDTVVQMLKDNGIKKVKLFEADKKTMSALSGSDIEVMTAIPNDELEDMNDYDNAKDWVKKNVKKYHFDGGVNIKYVAVGNEPFLKSYNGSFLKVTFPALKNIQNALNDAGLGDAIKATIPLNADVYDSPADQSYPSAGRFRSDIKDVMAQVVEFMDKNRAPFTVNIYPFLSLYGNDGFPVDYAFFEGSGQPVVDKKAGISYSNVFDANFDTLVSALKAVGHGNMSIVVGEVGWPTDGDKNANIANAQRFYNGLLPRLAANKGTPLRPGHIEAYLFGLLDEDAKSVAPGNFERHWGLFGYDGRPKFPLDLSGKKQNKLLVAAKDVQYLPNKWCMLDPEATDLSKLAENVDYACSNGDCTAIGEGSSCVSIDSKAKASYAFNMYFQMQSQKPSACGFNDLGKITTQNISQTNCNFPIQIVGNSARGPSPTSLVFTPLLFILFFL